MTLTAPEATLWRTRPGWGIAVDLTPPEVLDARRLRRLTRVVAASLALVLVAVVVAVVLARRQHAAAAAEHEAAQGRTARLEAQGERYADVTLLGRTVATVREQLPLVLGRDVDLVELMDRVEAGLPPTMSITSESIVLSPTAAAGLAADPATGQPAGPSVGTVTLTGTGREMQDLALFVDRLSTVPGVTEVVPSSNTRTRRGMRFTLTFDLTDGSLSHRFDDVGRAR